MDRTDAFEAERPRLLQVAARVLGDPHEAQDVVQNAWIRMDSSRDDIRNLPAWLTTVTTRLCLDRLRLRVPLPTVVSDVDDVDGSPDPIEEAILADTVGVALQVMLDRLTPTERVAFVLHDCFGFDFLTVAEILERTPEAARKLASRARGKVAQRDPDTADRRP
ncbi:sigma-70 family RNA polymerase sigma factor, partial [Tessaracoccus sp.]